MIHMKQINQFVDDGDVEKAETALEALLELGPKNTEAMKLCALIYERSGRFMDESKMWERVGRVDEEDPDYLRYLERRQAEEREKYYFTDELPDGGRRFLAYPRGVIYSSVAALIGCLFFLVYARVPTAAAAENQLRTLTVFAFCVIAPWLAIALAYLTSIKSISVLPSGIEIALRFRTLKLSWSDVEQACLVHHFGPKNPQLALVLFPKDDQVRAISVDLMETTTAIRARSHFLRAVESYVPTIANWNAAKAIAGPLKERKLLTI